MGGMCCRRVGRGSVGSEVVDVDHWMKVGSCRKYGTKEICLEGDTEFPTQSSQLLHVRKEQVQYYTFILSPSCRILSPIMSLHVRYKNPKSYQSHHAPQQSSRHLVRCSSHFLLVSALCYPPILITSLLKTSQNSATPSFSISSAPHFLPTPRPPKQPIHLPIHLSTNVDRPGSHMPPITLQNHCILQSDLRDHCTASTQGDEYPHLCMRV